MPQGQPLTVPNDGLTTKARRNAPVLAVHTGPGKGKSTAAFGMALRAWNQGFDVAVFQFVKSAKWKVGEEAAFQALGRLDASQRGLHGGIVDDSAAHLARHVLLDDGDARLDALARHVVETHVIAAQGDDMRDARPHLAGADHADRLDFTHERQAFA